MGTYGCLEGIPFAGMVEPDSWIRLELGVRPALYSIPLTGMVGRMGKHIRSGGGSREGKFQPPNPPGKKRRD